ncbi:formate dehydrogenase subunit gamma [uncultured Jannaschia sp.]|uniref:formate dehydrogenase subunit gamma n=1 Tax=uncultured Jannaschia sp. TaxID=293347 RepID=UPI00261A1246|nr:formate dehydrogenase subunit gamma [uncultured Jannaschia sp.]
MIRALLLLFTLAFAVPAAAQDSDFVPAGTQTVEDIMARQRALADGDESVRAVRDRQGGPDEAVADGIGLTADGTMGQTNDWSDPGIWRGVRYDDLDMRSQIRGPAATTLIQTGGMEWLERRAGPLRVWGGGLLFFTLVALGIFFLLRGRIRIDGPRTGRTLVRFRVYERFAHWLLAGSFLALAVTGLLVLFGRIAIIPIFGHEVWGPVAIVTKWVHNNISWAFMLALVMVFVLWVLQNIPDRSDWQWLKRAGGIFGGGHVPAKKFNAGQKAIFWAVIILGASLSVSGLSLLFPFEMPLFASTFTHLNDWGIGGLFGGLPTDLAPQEEMQLSQLWHGIVAFVMIAIIFAHIYLGSIGMEGAYDAMGKGRVEEQWAREHHSIWADKVMAERDDPRRKQTGSPDANPTPAE